MSVEDILDSEFKRLVEQEGKDPDLLTKSRARADFVEIDESSFCRIKNGDRRLSGDKARKIAQKLRQDAGEQERLAKRLQIASGAAFGAKGKRNRVGSAAQGSVEQKVTELFGRLSRPGALLCVEYRDLPRADEGGKYSHFAREAAKAIVHGLHFALFQPFGGRDFLFVDGGEERHTEEVRHYLHVLQRKVQGVFRFMREAVLDEEGGVEGDSAASRIVLYQSTTDSFVGSGIQSRLFYAEIPGVRTEKEVWEWVAGDGEDFFVKRDPTSTPPDVIEQQFFPVTAFWRKEGRLPQGGELKEALELVGDLEVNMGQCPWEIPGEGAKKKRAKRAGSKRA